ncbi:hypothetical protein [Sphingomonas lacusdianchii]|uniref:hypothetical protein n=1 Tax=Sphingomonas lacusdianchii TaxID=2917992 RepID=UPI001F573C93|nr:hypothetical protein [Sphingomonas sp. JXJ CY 53]
MAKHKKQKPKSRKAGVSTLRTVALGAAGIAVGLFGVLLARRKTPGEGHAAPDLALDKPHPTATDRAPDAFRPDPTAAVPASEREALRPATGPVPSMVAPRGSMASQTGA